MDRVPAVLLSGMACAILWGVGGAAFGGIARVFAQRWRRTPERTAGEAFRRGAVSGAAFTAVLGSCVGGLFGYLHEPDLARLIAGAAASCFILGVVGIVAVVFGSAAYFLEWICVSSPGELPSDIAGHGE